MSLESRLVAAFNAVGVDVKALQAALNAKLDANDPSVTNAREWTASEVSQAEAEAGTATTARKWTAQRVRQAAVAATQGAIDAKLDANDPSVTNAREWTASEVSQAEAEAGTATTARKWTAQRVRQAGERASQAFGLGAVAGPLSTDFDGITQTGFYLGNPATSAASGLPITTAGHNLIHMSGNPATNAYQIAQPVTVVAANACRTFIRQKNGGTWQPWKELALTDSPAFTGTPTIESAYSTTTASSANVFVTSTGAFQRSTSSERYKKDIEPADDALMQKVIDTAQPVWYRSICDSDPVGFSYWGLIAEQLAEIDPRFVHWAKHTEGGPLQAEGVMYDRLVVPLLWHAKKMQSRIEALESRLAAMEDK